MENTAQRDWTEICVTVPAQATDTAADIANMTVPYGIYIEDYSDLENEAMQIAHVDLISSKLLAKDRTKSIIHIYISPEENPHEAVSFLKERLGAEGIEHEISTAGCKTEDWINNWKKYWHPVKIGRKLLVEPLWEHAENPEGRAVLRLEPGLAFGTGSHPTTRLCLETLEELVFPEAKMLDVGCGSGILSIAALLLGAGSALGVDIDKLAVKTALENAAQNGFEPPAFNARAGDLSSGIDGSFDIVAANIVADVVMQLTPQVPRLLKKGGVFVTGGIIDQRVPEVKRCFAENGFEITQHETSNGWNVFVCKLK